jgi:hypothetical protein
MTKSAPPRHYESAQEEFQRRVRELYQLADKMGLRLTVSVKRKTEPETRNLPPLPKREPGEN